jgi:Flp pilus assembly protein TadD
MPGKEGAPVREISPNVFAAAGMAALVAHLQAAFVYSNWTWGFNEYFFLGRGWTIALIAAGFILCLPQVPGRLAALSAAMRRGGVFIRPHRLNDAVIALVCAVVFYLLRMPYHFLGDGRLMIRLLQMGEWFRPTELLDRLIHYVVLLATQPTLDWDAATVHAAVSIGAGFLFVLAALRLGRLLRQKLFVAAALITLGTVQLFFGYAESYCLATAAILVYILLALEYIAGRRRLVWVGAAIAVGVALHNALFFLLPSYIYVVAAKPDKEKTTAGARALRSAPFFAAIAALGLLTLAHGKPGGPQPLMLLPLLRDPLGQYTLFSARHAIDFLNEQILISPLAWVFAIGFLVAFAKDAAIRRLPRFRFLLAAAAFPLAFNLIVRPALGGSRDWDLWSMGSLPYVIAAVTWIATGMQRRRDLRLAAYTLVIVGFFHVLPWVLTNHSAPLSLDRFNRIAESNPLWPPNQLASSQSELGHFYIEQKEDGEALKHLELAVKVDPTNGRYWDALGVAYIGLRRYTEAEAPLRRAIEIDPNDASAYNNIGRAYYVLGRLDEAEAALKKAVALEPRTGPAYFNLGKIYASRGENALALEAYRKAAEVWPFVPDYWQSLAEMLEAAGLKSEAIDAWKRVVALTADDPSQQKAYMNAVSRLDALNR